MTTYKVRYSDLCQVVWTLLIGALLAVTPLLPKQAKAGISEVFPFVNCIAFDPDTGKATAVFGYENVGPLIFLLVSKPFANWFDDTASITSPNQGQNIDFQPGINNNVFAVEFLSYESITWHIGRATQLENQVTASMDTVTTPCVNVSVGGKIVSTKWPPEQFARPSPPAPIGPLPSPGSPIGTAAACAANPTDAAADFLGNVTGFLTQLADRRAAIAAIPPSDEDPPMGPFEYAGACPSFCDAAERTCILIAGLARSCVNRERATREVVALAACEGRLDAPNCKNDVRDLDEQDNADTSADYVAARAFCARDSFVQKCLAQCDPPDAG